MARVGGFLQKLRQNETHRDMGLTPQQVKAVQLLAKGHSQQEVADIVGVSRRTISRWLQSPEFKNLSFGLVNQVVKPPSQPTQPQPVKERHSDSLTPQDLVGDALLAVRDILTDPEARTCDRLKAASLVGDWARLSGDKSKMAEMEALKILIDANWVPDEVLVVLVEAGVELEEKIKDAFQNSHKKAV
jgi:uncharacterized protein YerC